MTETPILEQITEEFAELQAENARLRAALYKEKLRTLGDEETQRVLSTASALVDHLWDFEGGRGWIGTNNISLEMCSALNAAVQAWRKHLNAPVE